MLLNTKYSLSRFSLLLFALAFVCNINAQSCEESVSQARDFYYNQEYEYVPGSLNSCLDDFYYYKNDYVQRRNRDLVFRVYKLIILSYKELGYYEKADSKKYDLIKYFYGWMREEEVMRKLYETKI